MREWLKSWRLWRNRHVRPAGFAWFSDVLLEDGHRYHLYGRLWKSARRRFTVEVIEASPTVISNEQLDAAFALQGRIVTFYRANHRCECGDNPLDQALHLKDFNP